ncbi:hypothetical protein Ahy_A02g009616 [Arachis hypogaea]|uniref:Aminotransferase-like plant mobile domain-containing protein n=1 Tax=Arachis hypogaea TaxID=3818 RepID=A0A445EHL6_ARAHY|nr:hypothetical protein Ahy_A02g009616 [Arachis hypogaea]
MLFGECTITLQDVAYQLELLVDGRYVSGCLTDFQTYNQGGCPAWELLGVLPPTNQIQKFAVNCSWFQETFGECPEGADEKTVRRYAQAYIMMLLGTQLFADKSGNRIHIRWLPYVARLEDMGGYNWVGSTRVVVPVHVPSGQQTCCEVSRSVTATSVLDLLALSWFIWMPYSSPDVLQVVHSEVLEPHHTALWRCLEPPPAPAGSLALISSPLSSAMISGSTSSSSASSSNASPRPAGAAHYKKFGTMSPIPTSSPSLQLRSTVNEGEATGSTGGSFTGMDEDAPTGLELEPATVPTVWVFWFERGGKAGRPAPTRPAKARSINGVDRPAPPTKMGSKC